MESSFDEVGVLLERRAPDPVASFGWNTRLEYYATRLASFGSPRATNLTELQAWTDLIGTRLLLLVYEAPPSIESVPFVYYAQPTVSALEPSEGPATGGPDVAVLGSGMSRLAAVTAIQTFNSSVNRTEICRIGGILSANATVQDDGRLECSTPWGVGGAASSVEVALNGVDFVGGLPLTPPAAVRYRYVGSRPPRLVHAAFTADGARVNVRFDGAPTDMGGSGGALSNCSRLLRATTQSDSANGVAATVDSVVSLAGALCSWSSPSDLVVHLTSARLRPGDVLSLQPAILAARHVSLSCAVDATLCAVGSIVVQPPVGSIAPAASIGAVHAMAACDALNLEAQLSAGKQAWMSQVVNTMMLNEVPHLF